MNSENLSRWLGVGTNIGVLIGLLLLWTEISQNREMTKLELGAGMLELGQEQWLSTTNDTLSDAFTVAIFEPEKLTNQQMIALNGFMRGSFSQAQRGSFLAESGLFETDTDTALWNNIRPSLNNQFGQAWYLANKENLPTRITSVIDRKLPELSTSEDERIFNQIKVIIADSPDQGDEIPDGN